MIMSLVKLLAIGKSLISIKDKPNHYRMVRWGWPVKFFSPANPFAVASEPTTPTDNVRARESANAQNQPPATVHKETQSAGADDSMSKSAGPVTKAASKFLGALSLLPSKSHLKLHRGAHLRMQQPVQCELSLETVKVVRNDLSETDLEVVPIRCAPAKSLAKVDAAIAARTLTGADGPGETCETARSGELIRPA